MKKHIIIADLDDTLASMDHRLHYIVDPESGHTGHRPDADWPEFFRQCVHDTPIQEVISILQAFDDVDPYLKIIIVTGRSNEVRSETARWLYDHGVPYWMLLMRPAGSHERDDKMKRRLIKEVGIRPEEVLFALEDRQRVVDMWRSLGIRTLQVAPGDF